MLVGVSIFFDVCFGFFFSGHFGQTYITNVGSVEVGKGVENPNRRDDVQIELADQSFLLVGTRDITCGEGDLVQLVAVFDEILRDLALIIRVVRHCHVCACGCV